jgi:hypothetical protein
MMVSLGASAELLTLESIGAPMMLISKEAIPPLLTTVMAFTLSLGTD